MGDSSSRSAGEKRPRSESADRDAANSTPAGAEPPLPQEEDANAPVVDAVNAEEADVSGDVPQEETPEHEVSDDLASTREGDGRLVAQTGGVDPDCNGPYDCDGRGCRATGEPCHSECGGRHLDTVERSRFSQASGFMYPRRPSLVVTASRDMGKTASTWVFNAVRLLFRQGREACDSYWVRRLTRRSLEQRMVTGAHVLVKTHEWTDEISEAQFGDVLPLFTHVIVSVRKGFPPDPDWVKVATHVVHYEDIVEHDEQLGKIGALRVLRSFAEHLGITQLSDSDIRAVDYQLMTLPMPRSRCDQTTKLWPFHARRGGRPVPAAPPAGEAAGAAC